jgi:hypothetical protein
VIPFVRLATRTDEELAEPDLVLFPVTQVTVYVVIPLALVVTSNVAAPSFACTAEMVGAPGTETTGGVGVVTEFRGAPLPPPPPPQLVKNAAAKREMRDLRETILFNDGYLTLRFSAQCMCATASATKK